MSHVGKAVSLVVAGLAAATTAHARPVDVFDHAAVMEGLSAGAQ